MGWEVKVWTEREKRGSPDPAPLLKVSGRKASEARPAAHVVPALPHKLPRLGQGGRHPRRRACERPRARPSSRDRAPSTWAPLAPSACVTLLPDWRLARPGLGREGRAGPGPHRGRPPGRPEASPCPARTTLGAGGGVCASARLLAAQDPRPLGLWAPGPVGGRALRRTVLSFGVK